VPASVAPSRAGVLGANRGKPQTSSRPSQFATPPRALAPKELPSLSTVPHRPELRRRRDSSGCCCGVPPPATPGCTSRPNKPPNRTLVTSSTFSAHPPAETPTGVAQFRRALPAGPPRGDIANLEIFPGSDSQKVTQIVKADSLNLVNCVENHRKFRKMQGQFCWIRGELFYNFLYSGLS
jgi:hypothetical protein